MVGDGGVFGVCVFLGSVSTLLPAQAGLPGEGLRTRADVLGREFQKGGRLQGMSSRTPAAASGEVFEAVGRAVEARGVRQPGAPQVNYAEGGLTLSRTPLNEYEVRAGARVVSRARHTGAPSSAPVFEPGDRVEEVRRPDRDIRRGMSR